MRFSLALLRYIVIVTKPTHGPMYYASYLIAGPALAASIILLSFAHIPWLARYECSRWIILGSKHLSILGFLLPGAVLFSAGWAEKKLKHGFMQKIWSNDELARVRTLFESPLWRVATFFGVVAMIAVMTWGEDRELLSFFLALMFPLFAAVRMRTLLVLTSSNNDKHLWEESKPIQSDNWGEPVQPWNESER